MKIELKAIISLIFMVAGPIHAGTKISAYEECQDPQGCTCDYAGKTPIECGFGTSCEASQSGAFCAKVLEHNQICEQDNCRCPPKNREYGIGQACRKGSTCYSSEQTSACARFVFDMSQGQPTDPLCNPPNNDQIPADDNVSNGCVCQYPAENGLQLFEYIGKKDHCYLVEKNKGQGISEKRVYHEEVCRREFCVCDSRDKSLTSGKALLKEDFNYGFVIPEWEICLKIDGSTLPQAKKPLQPGQLVQYKTESCKAPNGHIIGCLQGKVCAQKIIERKATCLFLRTLQKTNKPTKDLQGKEVPSGIEKDEDDSGTIIEHAFQLKDGSIGILACLPYEKFNLEENRAFCSGPKFIYKLQNDKTCTNLKYGCKCREAPDQEGFNDNNSCRPGFECTGESRTNEQSGKSTFVRFCNRKFDYLYCPQKDSCKCFIDKKGKKWSEKTPYCKLFGDNQGYVEEPSVEDKPNILTREKMAEITRPYVDLGILSYVDPKKLMSRIII